MSNKEFSVSLNGFHLKYIALITMTLDHIGSVLLTPGTPSYVALRACGRIAFPVFCFLLTEGYLHTSNHKAYLKRLFLFALISELPFDMALYHFPAKGSYPLIFSHQNIFFTLSLGFLAICLIDRFFISNPILALFWFVFPVLVSQFLRFDYGAPGIMVILLFYSSKKILTHTPKLSSYTLALIPLLATGNRESFFVLLSLPFFLLYNGEKGRPLPGERNLPGGKFFFYWYYPCHLFLLAMICIYYTRH